MAIGVIHLLKFLLIVFSTALATYNFLTFFSHPSFNPAHQAGPHRAGPRPDPVVAMPRPKRLFHTAVTASEGAYNAWQCRVMYYWYKHHRAGPGGSEMGGFTRILHSGRPDSLMSEIPTFVADPLPAGTDGGYVVLNRPWAFVQWLRSVHIEEEYIFMAEPDHVIIRPIPNLSRAGFGAAFEFFYIEPEKDERIVRRFFPVEKGPITNVQKIGNSPAIVPKEMLKRIAPVWMNVSLDMKRDPEADKVFEWVLEMYAYAVASALEGFKHVLVKDFMLQPPWDTELGEKYIIHYTYGCDYDMQGNHMPGKFGEWRFDKRSYQDVAPPRNLTMPPPGVPETVVTLIKMINEASANIPDWDRKLEE